MIVIYIEIESNIRIKSIHATAFGTRYHLFGVKIILSVSKVMLNLISYLKNPFRCPFRSLFDA